MRRVQFSQINSLASSAIPKELRPFADLFLDRGYLVKLIREKLPSTPILLLDERTIESAPLVPTTATAHRKKSEALKQAYDNLIAAGVKDLHVRKGDDVLGNDQEGTVDGSHPTDLGMMRYADAIEPDIRKLLPSA